MPPNSHNLLASLHSILNQTLAQNGVCHFMLTGGRSATQLYRAWSSLPDYSTGLRGVQFYFGDERCVPPDHAESNYHLARNTLFPHGVPEGVPMHRMDADAENLDTAADRYAAQLPESIDILLLSMGEDGHIASLFPDSPALHELQRPVVPVTGPKPPHQRLTVTPPVIRSASAVIVMAFGEQKRAMYEKALRDPADIDAIPARLVLDRTWFFQLD